MKLLSKDLVSVEYREQLQRDLSRATVCRFLIAYISGDGMDSIGRHLLTRALRDPRSFGVASLTCSCGYEPLLRLQGELGAGVGMRLKYFMDPLVGGADEPSDLALFHSKLVFLVMEREKKAVIYLGSHNWSTRALGPGGPRNAEASLRLEVDVAPGDLEGTGTSVASEVNRHLLQAFALPACLPATEDNRARFEEWYQKGCRSAPPVSLQQNTVLLAVRKDAGTTVSPQHWQNLVGRGIYAQALQEDEGDKLWRSVERGVLILVWKSKADLQLGGQPIILHCRITTSKAGPNSKRRGTNQSPAPIAGFEAVVFDEDQVASMSKSAPSQVIIWSGRPVEIYDFEFPTQRTDSSQVDGTVVPKYQFHLEVEHVVFPEDGDRPEDPEMIWPRESFPIAKSKDSVRYAELPGYYVSADLERAILQCLTETLLIDPDQAKVLPVSQFDKAKVGKRVTAHPLHETFVGRKVMERREDFYSKSEPGSLVIDLDEQAEGERGQDSEPLERVQRVFTMPVQQLHKRWLSFASDLRSRNRL